MKKITETVVTAFMARKARSLGNTMTDGTTLYLHGNAIARHINNGIEVTLAGWPTVTTRERLNGIPGVRVRQAKGAQYLNGAKWDGSWTKVADTV